MARNYSSKYKIREKYKRSTNGQNILSVREDCCRLHFLENVFQVHETCLAYTSIYLQTGIRFHCVNCKIPDEKFNHFNLNKLCQKLFIIFKKSGRKRYNERYNNQSISITCKIINHTGKTVT